MKKAWFRLLAVLCTLALIAGASPASVSFAAEDPDSEYEVTGEGQQADDEKDEEEIKDDKDSEDDEESEDKDAPQMTEESEDDEDEPAVVDEEEDEQDPDEEDASVSEKDAVDSTQKENKNSKPVSGKGKVSAKEDPAEGTLSFELDKTSFVYTGSEIKPEPIDVKVFSGGSWVVLAKDEYDVTYAGNINVGTATITVTGGQGTAYKDSRLDKNFTITKAAQNLKVTANKMKVRYGKQGQLTVSGAKGKVTYSSSNKTVLTVGAAGKYTGKSTGTAVITVNAAATANYNAGKATIKITVTGMAFKASNTKIKLKKKKFTYDGKKKKPKVTVTYKKKKLKKGRDYKLTYQNNINAGKAVVIVTGKGKYSGTRKKKFTIEKAKNPMKAKIDKTSFDVGKKAYITVEKAVGKVTYTSSNTKIATVSEKGVVSGKGNGSCTITVKAAGDKNRKAASKKFKVSVGYLSLTSSDCKVTLSQTKYTFDGKAKKPTVTVRYAGTKLTLNKDYTLTYSNNINAGKAKVILKGKGRYINTRTVNFTIQQAEQPGFRVKPTRVTCKNGDTFSITTTGGLGTISYRSNSPSYLEHLGNGRFRAKKVTNDHVTITVTAEGNKNYKSKSITVYVSIN